MASRPLTELSRSAAVVREGHRNPCARSVVRVHVGQVFKGETEVIVKMDKFLVEDVTVFEEPALEGRAKVVFRGS